MACELARFDICLRYGDYAEPIAFSFEENGVLQTITGRGYLLEVRYNTNEVIKNYSIGAGLSIFQDKYLIWETGSEFKDFLAGEYTYAIKEIINGKPTTLFGGNLTINKELVKWQK